jgi:hypothetical protein
VNLRHLFVHLEIGYEMQLPGGVRTYKNHVNASVDACISGHIKLEHVITCTFGCTNGEMHVESFLDAKVTREQQHGSICQFWASLTYTGKTSTAVAEGTKHSFQKFGRLIKR